MHARHPGAENRYVIDFDIDAFFAPWHTFALMCWPDVVDRRLRLATLGIDLLGQVETVYGEFLKSAARIAIDGVPATGSLDRLIASCAVDAEHRNLIRNLADTIGKNSALPGTEKVNPEKLFWSYLAYRPAREAFPYLLTEFVKSGLVDPGGGFVAAARAPALDTIEVEFRKLVIGPPMFAGMILYVIARLRENLPALASKNIASEIIEHEVRINGQKPGKDSTGRAWKQWSAIAPLWAGVLSEAGCWDGGWQLTDNNLERQVMEVVASDERRHQAFAFAKWYRDEIALRGTRRSPEPLLTGGEVLGFPSSIVGKAPSRPTIPETVAADAKVRVMARK